MFRTSVLPAIQGVSLGALARRTGLSVPYLARVRRGEEVPHPRWWELLTGLQSSLLVLDASAAQIAD